MDSALIDETSWVLNGSADVVPRSTAGLLAGLFGGLAVLALVITCVFIDHIRVSIKQCDIKIKTWSNAKTHQQFNLR